MIAKKELPPEYVEWNRRHASPFGRLPKLRRRLEKSLPISAIARVFGPFAFQTNNTFRTFEYPWAFQTAGLGAGKRVLEIGGGLSGFQFVLSRHGCKVVNVDPGMEGKIKGWRCDLPTINRLNAALGTDVELRNCTVREAKLEAQSFDCAFSISVLEHLPKQEIENVFRAVYASLKPGGLFVLTTDLFLDLEPFTDQKENVYGENVSIAWMAGLAPFELAAGNPRELLGFPEFDSKAIHSSLDQYLVGSYPALAQCLVLRVPKVV